MKHDGFSSDPSDLSSSDTCTDPDWTSGCRPGDVDQHDTTCWTERSGRIAAAGEDWQQRLQQMKSEEVQAGSVDGVTSPQYRHCGRRGNTSIGYMMSPDAEERLRIRRERNKQAAARCRQRRVDLTNQLLAETELLEDEKAKLKVEIAKLQQQRYHLEHVLMGHASRCTAVSTARPATVVEHQPTTINMLRPRHADVTHQFRRDSPVNDYVTAGRSSTHVVSIQHPVHLTPVSRSSLVGPCDVGGGSLDDYGLGDCFNSDGSGTGLTPVMDTAPFVSNELMMTGSGMLSPTTLMTL